MDYIQMSIFTRALFVCSHCVISLLQIHVLSNLVCDCIIVMHILVLYIFTPYFYSSLSSLPYCKKEILYEQFWIGVVSK
ncbi:unnamed protein product [Brugia timori]|uniref:Ovule protein n=1 Tax=Brugia timori TaxID=42155 RepID=A0A0R3QT45_9BILA|nr:unnamed protein product [Brugia timori]